MMSTPAATSVESVREKRAIDTFSTTSPIFIGSFSLNLSQFCRPFSVFFQRKNDHRPSGMMSSTYGLFFSRSDAVTTYWVSVGSWPPSWLKIFTKTGTRNMSIPTSTSVAKISTIVG